MNYEEGGVAPSNTREILVGESRTQRHFNWAQPDEGKQ